MCGHARGERGENVKLDLTLLSMRFSQAKEEPPVPTDGVNPYLLEKILLPCMNGESVLLRDIDYEAFEIEDVGRLEEYYNDLSKVGRGLYQFTKTVWDLPPEARKARLFC